MPGCSYVERRGGRYYFRMRMPLDLAIVGGRTHIVTALGTTDARVAKIKSARLFLSLAALLETMRLRMARAFDIDGNDFSRLQMLAAGAFALGQEYEACKERLRQDFSIRLSRLITGLRDEASATEALPHAYGELDEVISAGPTQEQIAAPAGPAVVMLRPNPAEAPALKAWTAVKQTFFDDKPGLTKKTLWSYNQAFDAWEALIGHRPIRNIRRPDVKAFADFLRNKDNPRGGKLDHKTIQRSLGHIKTFMVWAVAAGHAVDDRFETVAGRDMTKQEQLAGDRRRAITAAELDRMFGSPIFTKVADESDAAASWFLAIAALTGARTEEITLSPAKLVLVGDIHCLDLRESGRKTSAAPRLIPLLPDLVRMGLLGWARKQEARGYSLVQPCAKQRTAAAWSKLLNRHLNATVSDDPAVVLYSLRHSFRQMLRAGNIGDELADKIFGHSTGKVGAGYGRELSPAEAQLFIGNVKPPVDLKHLWRGG